MPCIESAHKVAIERVLSYSSSSADQCVNIDPERTDRKWKCIDKDDIEAGYVMGESEQVAVTNYINCAAGASCFERSIYALVNGETRLNVREAMKFHKLSNLPNLILVGSINAEFLDKT